jgi:hypothetical protein
MCNQSKTLEVTEDEFEQYWDSRWRDAYSISDMRDDLCNYLRYVGANDDAIKKVEDAYKDVMACKAFDWLIDAIEEALPDTLQKFVSDLREQSND